VGIKTEAEIEIDASPEQVFAWVTEREKFAQWAGADPDYLPADPSELKQGYRATGHMQAPDGPRELQFEVTEWDPPSKFGFRDTYDGGDQTTTYSFEADRSGTKLHVSSDTDYAKMAMPAAASAQLEQLPEDQRSMIQKMIQQGQEQIAAGAYDDNPMVREGMQKATEQSLEKLKKLVEGAG
jgi:uncharacterized protein YndB with AHSA1/START domain